MKWFKDVVLKAVRVLLHVVEVSFTLIGNDFTNTIFFSDRRSNETYVKWICGCQT